MKQQQDGGFTLIEVLIVIVILGVLASVVAAAVFGFRSDTEVSACQKDAKTLATAAEAYFAQNAVSVIPDADGTLDGYENSLVSAQYLRSPSIYHDLNADGELVPVAGAPCTG
jgi:prepilin-type N-terminal cleavage/methylation domain-containing protein